VTTAGDEPVASGRFVVLHDPQGQEGWHGVLRVVAFARAPVDDDMARDPLLADVAWSWLTEALESHTARSLAAGGTVTTTASRRFGLLADPGGHPPEACEVENRCSWTPEDGTANADLVPHLEAFCDLLGTMAGVPPPHSGVTALRAR
jgi:hypothetical protein